MTFPFLYDDDPQNLGYEAKWKIIGDVIDYAITEGFTQTSTRNTLREQGFTFGNTPFSQLWQTLADYRVRFEYPTTLDPDTLPNIQVIQPSSRIQEGVFQYKGWMEVYDENADRMVEQFFSINSTDLLSANDALAKLWEFANQNYNVSSESLQQFYYIGALRGTG